MWGKRRLYRDFRHRVPMYLRGRVLWYQLRIRPLRFDQLYERRGRSAKRPPLLLFLPPRLHRAVLRSDSLWPRPLSEQRGLLNFGAKFHVRVRSWFFGSYVRRDTLYTPALFERGYVPTRWILLSVQASKIWSDPVLYLLIHLGVRFTHRWLFRGKIQIPGIQIQYLKYFTFSKKICGMMKFLDSVQKIPIPGISFLGFFLRDFFGFWEFGSRKMATSILFCLTFHCSQSTTGIN